MSKINEPWYIAEFTLFRFHVEEVPGGLVQEEMTFISDCSVELLWHSLDATSVIITGVLPWSRELLNIEDGDRLDLMHCWYGRDEDYREEEVRLCIRDVIVTSRRLPKLGGPSIGDDLAVRVELRLRGKLDLLFLKEHRNAQEVA